MAEDKDEWAKPSNKFVAFFDVMGFKDFVYSNSHAKVVERINKLSSFIEFISSKEDSRNKILGKPISNYLKAILVSDSIIICSKGDSKEDLFAITNAVGTLMAGCLNDEIPIKGAISHGYFTFNSMKSIYVGKPLINASLLEASIEFYGCIIDNCVEKQIENLGLEELFYKHYRKISVPTKDGKINYHTSKVFLEEGLGYNNQLDTFYKTVSGKPRRYIDNSIKIYQELDGK